MLQQRRLRDSEWKCSVKYTRRDPIRTSMQPVVAKVDAVEAMKAAEAIEAMANKYKIFMIIEASV